MWSGSDTWSSEKIDEQKKIDQSKIILYQHSVSAQNVQVSMFVSVTVHSVLNCD